jgi:hypothetical protein
MMRPVLFGLGLAVLGACGAPESPQLQTPPDTEGAQALGRANIVRGTVLGQGIEVRDAIYMRYPLKHVDGKPVETVSILLSDRPNLCDYLREDSVPRNLALFGITLQRGPSLVVNPGTYDVRAPVVDPEGGETRGRAYAQLLRLDDECSPVLPASSTTYIVAHEGELELHTGGSQAAPRVNGTFEFSFGPQQDAVSGRFDASLCPLRSHAFTNCVD